MSAAIRPKRCCCSSRSPPPTTTLTVALALHGVTSAPYAATRAATAGPDVVAAVQQGGHPPAQLTALEHAPGVVASSGPYLIAMPNLVVDGHSDPVMAEGRDPSAASVDQPKLTAGHWVTNGGVVVERSLADLLDLKVGDRVGLDPLSAGDGPAEAGPASGGPGRWAHRAVGRPSGRRDRRHRGAPASAAQHVRPSVGISRSRPRLGDPLGRRAAGRRRRAAPSATRST